MEAKVSTHGHKYIQKVDEYDQLRWHECTICKSSEDCDCSEEEFEKRLKEAMENQMDALSNHIIDMIIEYPNKYLLKSEKEKS